VSMPSPAKLRSQCLWADISFAVLPLEVLCFNIQSSSELACEHCDTSEGFSRRWCPRLDKVCLRNSSDTYFGLDASFETANSLISRPRALLASKISGAQFLRLEVLPCCTGWYVACRRHRDLSRDMRWSVMGVFML
jgi:hypothetical protein